MKKKETGKKKLTPPDKQQCQAEHQIGAFVMGGQIGKLTRCNNTPTVIVTEKKKGKDGLIGSMSLCEKCLNVAKKQLGENSFTIKKI